jgi:hypothetical protein
MEHVVNGPGHWKLQLIRHRRDLSDDLEGSLTFRRQFGSLIREFQIARFEPYLFPNLKHVFSDLSRAR